MTSNFIIPTKKIFSEKDVKTFNDSIACLNIMEFLEAGAAAITGAPFPEISSSEGTIFNIDDDDNDHGNTKIIHEICNFLIKIGNDIDNYPPIQQPQRFGNKAFRDWYEFIKSEIKLFLSNLLPNELKDAIIELEIYLLTCFGNETRLDYGTGHETTFIIFMICIFKLGLIKKEELREYILKVFSTYIKTVRKLQTMYMLEPAGSHGVWGLDDYHCLIFLWGAAQLRNNNCDIQPDSVHSDVILEQYKTKYFYLEGIAFIKEIKSSAPFAETSPMLNSISGPGNDWNKIYKGMIRLYKGEVLQKFPVIQHLLFGSIFSFDNNNNS